MDAYHYIEPGRSYPRRLIEAGMNDSRVPPWHSTKFYAKLKASNSSDESILLNLDFDKGDSSDSSDSEKIRNMIDVLSFAFWKTGNKFYQFKI